jgi:cytochrome c553
MAADVVGAATLPLQDCVRCHGAAGTSVVSDLVPKLHALPRPYLERSLREYRQQVRDSGIMAPIAHEMTELELDRFAAYYAGLAPVPSAAAVAPELADRGRRIAEQGIPERDVPACITCHNGGNSQIPPLAGQSSRYMANQLLLWRDPEFRSTSPFGSLMAAIGRRLTDQDAEAVSAWYGAGP